MSEEVNLPEQGTSEEVELGTWKFGWRRGLLKAKTLIVT